MKAGFAYMNDLTVIQASQGFSTYLENTVPGSKEQGINRIVVFNHSNEFY